MPPKRPYYITTSILYANDVPHVGHSLELIGADVVARAKRLLGYDVFFQTGTDEHGQKMLEAASKNDKEPQEYVDEIVPRFEKLWRDLGISYDQFIRTTADFHKEGVAKFWRTVRDNGDIYLGKYEGWYCLPEEKFFLESQVKPGPAGEKLCPDCGRELSWSSEDSYFFKLSNYQETLTKYLPEHPELIGPSFRANEMINSFLKPGLQDISISRSAMKWGIPVPDDPNHVVYVWFDALINYITGIGYGTDEDRFNRYWPANMHVIGKDIVKFHTLLWPAMCMSAGIAVPKRVFVHGFIFQKQEGPKVQLREDVTYKVAIDSPCEGGKRVVIVNVLEQGRQIGSISCDSDKPEAIAACVAEKLGEHLLQGEKMSKSRGNVLDPYDIIENFGGNPDPLRFFLMREIDFGQDGIFSMENLKGRYNSDLANDLGNLLARTLTMVEKYQNGVVNVPGAYTDNDDTTRATIMALFQRAELPGEPAAAGGYHSLYEQMIDECNFGFLLQRVWAGISRLNTYINEQQPWKMAKDVRRRDELAATLYVLCEGLRVIATMIYPFIPGTAEKIWAQLGLRGKITDIPFERLRHWGYIGETRVARGENLFPKLEA